MPATAGSHHAPAAVRSQWQPESEAGAEPRSGPTLPVGLGARREEAEDRAGVAG